MGEEPEAKLGVGNYAPGAGVGVGAALGVAIGAAVDHLALGLALGTAFGCALDVVLHKRQMNTKKLQGIPAGDDATTNQG